MFEDAYKGGYAVGAFIVNNIEIIQGMVEHKIKNVLGYDNKA